MMVVILCGCCELGYLVPSIPRILMFFVIFDGL